MASPAIECIIVHYNYILQYIDNDCTMFFLMNEYNYPLRRLNSAQLACAIAEGLEVVTNDVSTCKED